MRFGRVLIISLKLDAIRELQYTEYFTREDRGTAVVSYLPSHISCYETRRFIDPISKLRFTSDFLNRFNSNHIFKNFCKICLTFFSHLCLCLRNGVFP